MKKRSLRIGLDYAAPIPLHTDISSENFEGFEVDLMNEIAKELNLDLEYSVAYWKDIINDLKNNKIDAICSAATITPERGKTVGFSKPYLSFHLAVVCHKEDVLSLNEFSNKDIGVRVSTEAEDYIQNNLPNARLKYFDSNEEIYESLTKKLIQALIDDSPIAIGFTSRNHEIVLTHLIPETSSQYAILISKENVNLKNEIDQVIDKLENNGFLAEKRLKWFKGKKL